MAALDRPLLNDPHEPPDDELLSRHLGPAKDAWDAFTNAAPAVVDGLELTWRYYTDGKAWLCKAARRGRTICWISVRDGGFRATFYFTEKADAEIVQLAIDRGRRDAYASATRAGKLKPLRVDVADATDLPDLYSLMRFKATR